MKPAELHTEPAPGRVPQVLYRDEHLLAVDKPPGWLTHADGTGARPDVVSHLGGGLGVHQRLDVDTSGVLLFSLSKQGAKRLHDAFAGRGAHKRYLAVVEGAPEADQGTLTTPIDGKPARSRYRVLRRGGPWTLLEAMPETGRTHQIRRQLAGIGCPVRADLRYGDALDPRAPRLLLHCHRIELDGLVFEAPPPPELARYRGEPPAAARAGLAVDPDTTCYRELNGATDGAPGWKVDRYADWLFVQQDRGAPRGPLPEARGVYLLDAKRDRSHDAQPGPHLTGEPAPPDLPVTEHGIRYRADLREGQLSTGLFLDQRPQRLWLSRHAAGMRVLNTFAHAGAFSVAAARAGAETVSIDLSKAWLERIPPQLVDNGVDPAKHDWIYGDVFDWLRRLARRGERYDLVILDPPSTSVGKKKKRWSAARDYPELVELAAPLVAPGGRLWTATNHRKLTPARFAGLLRKGLPAGATLERVCPPAVDFPTDGPAPVKTWVWRLD